MGELVTVLNRAGGAFLAWAGPMLLQSSVLIVMLAVLDLVLRKRIKAVVRYWIWLLVLVKLLLPPSLSSPTGLVSWVGSRLPQTTWDRQSPDWPSSVPLGRAAFPEEVSGVASTPTEAPPRPEIVTGPVSEPAAVSAPAASVPPTVLPTWQALILLGWLAAVLVMGVLLIQRLAFVRALLAQAHEAPETLRAFLEQCRRQMGLRRRVGIRLTDLSTSPSVCGLWRPVVLMPESMARQLGTAQLRSILFHELAHIQRGDLWINLLQTLLQIAYLYHPLLWWANARIRAVREQAVDETVLAALGEEAEEYPRTLLSVSKLAFSRPALSLRLLGVVESEKALTARIRHMVSRPFPRNAKLGFVGLVLVLVVGAALLPMASAAPAQTQSAVTPTGATTDSQSQPAAGDQDKTTTPREETVPIAVQAGSSGTSSPADGAEGIGVNGLELTWRAGDKAKAHNLYLGISPENLELLGKVEQAGAQVSHLRSNTKYYWRVDEVRTDGSTTTGTMCSFTTGGLAGWWKLDEASGNIAGDSSGSGNQGTLHGVPQRVNGPSGGPLSFDGIDDYVDCGSAPSLMRVGSVSVAAWVNLEIPGRDAKIVSNQDKGSGYKLGVYTNNKVEFEIRAQPAPDVTPTTNRFESDGTELQPDTWYHVVGVYEKGRYIRTYVNGELDRDTKTPEIAAVSNGPLVIGREPFAPTTSKAYWWQGALRDVCVFTYALNPDEVKALYSGTTPIALTRPPVSSEAKIVLAPLDAQARLAPAKKPRPPFGQLATASLNAWVSVQVLEQRMVVLDTHKPFSDYWPTKRHEVVGASSEKETLDYLQGRLTDVNSLPIRIHIYHLPETMRASKDLAQKIFALAREAHADMKTEVSFLGGNVFVGSGESPLYLRAGKLTTFYPHRMPRPDGCPGSLTSGLVDPNDLEQHLLWRLAMPKNVPLTFRIEYDEPSYELAKQVAEKARAVARRVGLADLVKVAGALVEAAPEDAFLGKWQALNYGVIQSVDIQPGGVCQVTMGGTEAIKAGTTVQGTWAWTVKEILLDVNDKIRGLADMPSYIYRADVNAQGDLIIERGEIWPQGSFMYTRPPQMVLRKVQ